MARIRTSSKQTKLLARLMRAEAEGEGKVGMLLVGNVGVNRVVAECLDFEDVTTLKEMIFQSPGGFEAVQKPYFYRKARQKEVRLANRVIKGERRDPATNSLWFFRPEGACPARWFDQAHSGRYKAHCFYNPTPSDCPEVY